MNQLMYLKQARRVMEGVVARDDVFSTNYWDKCLIGYCSRDAWFQQHGLGSSRYMSPRREAEIAIREMFGEWCYKEIIMNYNILDYTRYTAKQVLALLEREITRLEWKEVYTGVHTGFECAVAA